MLLWLTNGVDVLALLTLPVALGLMAPAPMFGWRTLLQTAFSAVGAAALLLRSAQHAGRLRSGR
jgi:hypothetical protein